MSPENNKPTGQSQSGSNHANGQKKKNRRPYYNKKKHRNNNGKQNENRENNNVISEAFDDATDAVETEVADNAVTLEFYDSEIPSVSVAIEDEEDVKKVHVSGVRFKANGKIYHFDKGEISPRDGDFVIVETARGLEFGEVAYGDREVKESSLVLPLRPVIRIATPEDIKHNEENHAKEESAFKICLEKIAKHGLDMKLIEAQYSFDNSKLLFYFTSASRVDFRELVKDLASVFKTRIELRQIGIRDEAKLMGGLGVCGRPLCCSTFLSDFVQVSIKMAKEQNLSLNSGKISGCCGRLMCCLQYEYSTYAEETAKTPPVDSTVKTPDGVGVVTEINPLAATVKVRLNDKPDVAPTLYNRDKVTVLSKPSKKDDND